MNKKKVLIIDGAMVARSPHVAMYINILSENSIKYDVAVWNRKGDDTTNIPSNYIVYNNPTEDNYPAWRKIIEISKFYRFVINHINKSEYQAVIIFEIANSFLFCRYLKKNFKGKYIFDIRDYSPFMKLKPARYVVQQIIKNSFTTVISSKGFLEWLPNGYDYTISHNIDMGIFNSLIDKECRKFNSIISVLTIGNLRDPEINCAVAQSFANKELYHLKYIGDGAALPVIKDFCNCNNIKNVSFGGHYEKKDEIHFYEEADVINCCMESNILSNYLMSNRIYLAALLQKPILCNEGSFQSETISKYNLGCVIPAQGNPKQWLDKYISQFDYGAYYIGRCKFLQLVKNEQSIFTNTLLSLVKQK